MEWEDSTENVVCTSLLEYIDGKTFRKGKKVRMHWNRKYYYGIFKDIEKVPDSDDVNSSGEHFETNEKKYENVHNDTEDEDDLPLSSFI